MSGQMSASVSSIEGYAMDLEEIESNFTSNGTRLFAGLVVPAGTTGLLAEIGTSITGFEHALSDAHGADRGALNTLSTGLKTTSNNYQSTDGDTAAAIAAQGNMTANVMTGVEVERYPGLQLPTLPDATDNQFTVCGTVTACINAVAPYDDVLSKAIGVKPAADYLTPLTADWEALQAVGKRIGSLGIVDYVTSENLAGGNRWLQSRWSGDAAQGFDTSITSLSRSLATRSLDLEATSRIVEYGGTLLERLVYNQAAGISEALTKPINLLGFALPLSAWAQIVDWPMHESVRSQISAAVDELKTAMESRKTAITTAVTAITQALAYMAGRQAPVFDPTAFEVPEKVSFETVARRYGFNDGVWWEDSLASAS
ncbi:hypothetical protein ACFWUP_23665 [Nocardia sp. NPDC058658]|uniref:hypothetical protein n=1 Tax=Nocardia sp. NPDC058658 TaxID=3346580 RepID=UPI00364F29FF